LKEKPHTNKEVFGDEWLTPKEAASLLKIHRSTIYRWADEGLLTLYNLGNRLTRLKRTEVEQLIEPKKPKDEVVGERSEQNDIRQTPARLGVATATDLEAIFMPLARKHDVEEQKAQQLMRELEEVLGIRKKPDERSFDENLHDARKAFDQMANHLIDDEYPIHLRMFANEVKALLDKLSKVNERRGQLVILLKKAARQWQKSAERATTEQVEAVKAVFDCLKNETPQKDDVMACADKLEDTGIRVTADFGAAAEIFIQWADEGMASELALQIDSFETAARQSVDEVINHVHCDLTQETVQIGDYIHSRLSCNARIAQCQLVPFLSEHREQLLQIQQAMESAPREKVDQRTLSALRRVNADVTKALGERTCWALGDVIIALEAPDDALIYVVYEVNPSSRLTGILK